MHFRIGCTHPRHWENWAACNTGRCAHPKYKAKLGRAHPIHMRTSQLQGKMGCAHPKAHVCIPATCKLSCMHFRIGCAHPRHRENWAVHNTGRCMHLKYKAKLDCTHPRHMCASQVQSKIVLCELLKQSRQMVSSSLAAATPEAQVFSVYLSCIFCLFTGWCRWLHVMWDPMLQWNACSPRQLCTCQLNSVPEAQIGISYWDVHNRPLSGVL